MLLVPFGAFSVAAAEVTHEFGAAAQVARGAANFERLCSRCHSKDLAGGQGPALRGDTFKSHWVGKPARALYSRILLTMPLDSPGTLTPKQVMDLAAFLIANSFKAPAASFTSPEQMGKITLEGSQ